VPKTPTSRVRSQTYVYDAGALVAIGRGRDDVLRRHQRRLGKGDRIIIPAPVAAQVVRDPRRQPRLMLTLRTCDVVPFDEADAAPVGRLLAGAGTTDVIDGFVALTATSSGAAVVTSDSDDIRHLLDTLGVRLAVFGP